MDDPHRPSEVMSSWCMCEWRDGGVGGGVDESVCLRLVVFGLWFFDPMLSPDAE